MTTRDIDVLGLFPSFESATFGGIQASGREAWEGIRRKVGEQRLEVLCYDGRSKARAIARVLASRGRPHTVLVWHLHLLKLVPLLARAARPRVVVFLHGIEAWRRLDPVTARLLRQASLILSNSDFTWSRFVECNPDFAGTDHRTVHLGLGSPLLSPVPQPAQPPVVLMIGRLDAREDYKGHRQMIDAWRSVLKRAPGARLRIVGAGDLRGELEQRARDRAIAGSVEFLGAASESDKQRLIAQCRVLAMPSRGEGFGLAYLEAMRMGRPCLVSTVDGGREVVAPPTAGLAVDPGNSIEVAEGVARLLTADAEWWRWSASAVGRYTGFFTAEHFHRRLNDALFAA